jgi:hypothetical protein
LAASTVWYLFFFISAGTLKIKRLESQIIQMSLGAGKPKIIKDDKQMYLSLPLPYGNTLMF